MPDDPLQFDGVVKPLHFAELSKASVKRFHRGGYRFGLFNGLVLMGASGLVTWGFMLLTAQVARPRVPMSAFGPPELVLAALLTGVILSLVLAWLLGQRTHRLYQSVALREGGSFLGPRRYTLDTEGIRLEGDHGYAMTRWATVIEMTEEPNTYLLWTDPSAAVMVPKDALQDAAARGAFVAFVGRHLSKAEC